MKIKVLEAEDSHMFWFSVLQGFLYKPAFALSWILH